MFVLPHVLNVAQFMEFLDFFSLCVYAEVTSVVLLVQLGILKNVLVLLNVHKDFLHNYVNVLHFFS